MIRKATENDIPHLMEIRFSVRENRLSTPSRVKAEDYHWFLDNPGIFLWEDAGRIVGFSAADPRNGNIWALFIDPVFEGRGIGRALLERVCKILAEAGFQKIWLTTDPGTRAETFYRNAGWQATGFKENEILFEKSLG